jgi:hypothetical protein
MSNTKLNLCENVYIKSLIENNFLSKKNNTRTIFCDIVLNYFNSIKKIVSDEIISGRYINDDFLDKNNVEKNINKIFNFFKTDILIIVSYGYDLNINVYVTNFNNNNDAQKKYSAAIPFYMEAFFAQFSNESLMKVFIMNTNLQILQFLIEINKNFNITELYTFSISDPISLSCLIIHLIKKILNEIDKTKIKMDDKCHINDTSLKLTKKEKILCIKYIIYYKILDLFIRIDNFENSYAIIEKKNNKIFIYSLIEMLSELKENDTQIKFSNYLLNKINLKKKIFI